MSHPLPMPPTPQDPMPLSARRPIGEKSDDELVAGILEGCSTDFDALFSRYGRRVLRFAQREIGDAAEAEDICQEVFLEVHRRLHTFEGRSRLVVWLMGIARNKARARIRRRIRERPGLGEQREEALVAREAAVDHQVDAARMLRRCTEMVERDLTDGQRQIFHLHFAERLPAVAIAARLETSPQAVKASIHRSRRTLQRRAEEMGLAVIEGGSS